MRNQALINLPPERAEQLRQIADQLGITIVDIVGELIQQHIKKGTIADEVPGVVTMREGKSIAFGVMSRPDHAPMILERLAVHQAREIADIIDAATMRPKPGGWQITAGPSVLQIARVGTSVVFAQGEHRRAVAYAVARDIAAQLRRAADGLDSENSKAA